MSRHLKLLRDTLWGSEVMQIVGWYSITPSTVGYSPGIDPPAFDPAKARQLLADAGYPGGKGFGKVIVHTSAGQVVPFIPEATQIVADSWRKNLGLDVEVRLGDATALRSIYKTTENMYGQMYFDEGNSRVDGLALVSQTNTGGKAFERVTEDPELIALVVNANAVIDPVEREKTLITLYRRLADEQYQKMIGTVNVPWGVGPRIQTWQPYPLSLYVSAIHTITLK